MTQRVEAFMSNPEETRFASLLRDLLLVAHEVGLRPGSVAAMLLREVGAIAWLSVPPDGLTEEDSLRRALDMAEPNIRQGFEDERAEERGAAKFVKAMRGDEDE